MKLDIFVPYAVAFVIIFTGVPVQASSFYALGTVHTGLLADTEVNVQAPGVRAETNASIGVQGEVKAGEESENNTSSTRESSLELEAGSEGEAEVIVRGWDTQEKKEIVVKRSEVTTEAQGSAAFEANIATVETTVDLEAFAEAMVQNDENISLVMLTPTETSIFYRVPGKFLGVVPMTLNAQVSLDQEGRVKVKYPWYAKLVKKQVNFNDTEIENEVKASLVVTPGGETLAAQASGLQALGRVLKVTHDISLAASLAK